MEDDQCHVLGVVDPHRLAGGHIASPLERTVLVEGCPATGLSPAAFGADINACAWSVRAFVVANHGGEA